MANVQHITTDPLFPLWIIALLFFLGAAAAVAQYIATRSTVGKRRAVTLAVLRLGAVSLVLLCALNPSLTARTEHRLLPSLAVLVDTSESMGQPADAGRGTRLDAARSLLLQGAAPLLRSLKEQFDVSLYGLADALKPLDPADLAEVKAGGGTGDLDEALKKLSEDHSLALLLSDGSVRRHEGQTPPLPTIAVPFGDPATYRDILIKAIKTSTLAFRGRETTLEVTVKQHGFRGLTLPVLLKKSGRLLTARNVHFSADAEETTVALTFVPEEVGRQQLSISLPAQGGESSTANNQIDYSLTVLRDKTRILMISGRPSMNYRFLRMALKSDPSIDLLSFVILRTPTDILNVPANEQSLIPFPVETLFTKDLNSFDLVIFDNFDYALYLRRDYLENLRKFVKDGGGFALIGGADLFNEGRSDPSPLADCLPLRFVGKESYRRETPARVRLTQAGVTHPLFGVSDAVSEVASDRSSLWQTMPPLDGINTADAKRSSTVLLETADGVPWPILTVASYGTGRVLVLATDYAWKWYMAMIAKGVGNQPYLGLVRGMTHWLTKDPLLEPVRLILPDTSPVTGQEVTVRVQAQAGHPSLAQPNSVISFAVVSPEGGKISSNLKNTGQPGEHLLTFLPEKSGTYRIEVETPRGRIEDALVVAGRSDRLDAAPDHDLLRRVAEATKGAYARSPDELRRALKQYSRQGERPFVEERHRQLWATPLAMALILGFLSAEWYLRRRWGLI